MDRRTFLVAATAAAGASLVQAQQPSTGLHLATNAYPWRTFYEREGCDFSKDLPGGLLEVKAAGLDGFEPAISAPEELDTLAPLLKTVGLEMRSLYVNSELHDADRVKASSDAVLAIGRRAAKLGVKIMVTNPSPIQWGSGADKSDAQLITQAKALDALGAALRQEGLTLAYHNHDAELRQGARELHHMLTATDPAHVKFCLDAHWVYRGCGASQVALDDVLRIYAPRIVELHIRQSKDNVWTEVLGPGDIDYPQLVAMLVERSLEPHVVLEQAVEAKSPKSLSAQAAHAQSVLAARKVFAPLASG